MSTRIHSALLYRLAVPAWLVAALIAATVAVGALALLAGGCGAGTGSAAPGQVEVVATTTQIADFARAVGGERAKVVQVLAPNTDPHDYEPRPSDVRETARADVVLLNGDELDRWMGDVVEAAGGDPKVVDLGASVPVKLPGPTSGPEASRYDAHWWHNPRNAEAAVAAIRDALTRANPGAREVYARNAAAYLARLRSLDHGIAVVGAVIPSQSTQAQPSAGDVARLTRLIRRERVEAVFPESSINAKLAQAIARQTGATSDHELYGDTLGPKGSSGATYLTMERANADAMVRGFTGGAQGCPIPGI